VQIVMLPGKDRAEPYREFDAGEEVWIVYARTLIVRCTICEVNKWARNSHASAFLFYDVDEPIGHDLPEDELYTSKEEALWELALQVDDELNYLKENKDQDAINEYTGRFSETLDDLRTGFIHSIAKTHGDKYKASKAWMEQAYPKKERGIDWFNYNDLISETKYPKEEDDKKDT